MGIARVRHIGLELIARNFGVPRNPLKILKNAKRDRLKKIAGKSPSSAKQAGDERRIFLTFIRFSCIGYA